MPDKITIRVSTFFLLLAAAIGPLPAQDINFYSNPVYGPDSASRLECANNLSTMSEYMKIQLYKQAMPAWHYVLNNCPGSSKNIYIYGTKIYKEKIENTENEERKKELLDTLMMLYDMRIKYFGQKGYYLGRKGIDLLRYNRSAVEEAYGYLKESVDILGKRAIPPIILTYMQTTGALYQMEKIEPRDVIDNYLRCMDILENREPSGRRPEITEKVMKSVEGIFANCGAAACEDLISIFGPKFEENKNDAEFLKKVIGLLKQGGCEGEDLFIKASEALYQIEPSAFAAKSMATMFLKKENYEKAVDYYLKTVELEEDPEEKARHYHQLALIHYTKYKDFPQARSYARNAIESDPNWGEPYILIGNLYASSANQCGENEFEKSAVYLVAVDQFLRAKNVDESVAEKANELINRYSQHFPDAEDAFFYGFSTGNSYTVGCWINETTTIRTTGRN